MSDIKFSTPAELAAILNNREYPRTVLLTTDERKAAEAAGLVVAYGMSDDLLEIEGAWNDEFGSDEGATVRFSRAGFLPNECDQGYDCPNFNELHKAQPAVITANWGNDTPNWTIDANFPVERFTIVEDGEPFSVGVVFRLADVPELGDSPELAAARVELVATKADLAAARAERDHLKKQLAENNAALARRMGI